MTVKELIQALQALPENAVVCEGYWPVVTREISTDDIYVNMKASPVELVFPDGECGLSHFTSLSAFIETSLLIED